MTQRERETKGKAMLNANEALIQQRYHPVVEVHVYLTQEIQRFASWYAGKAPAAVLPAQEAAAAWIAENVNVKTWNGRPRITTTYQAC